MTEGIRAVKLRAFAIKAKVLQTRSNSLEFLAQKTMYAGKGIAVGDSVFVFASENDGGEGLIARAVVTSAQSMARIRSVARQTPRVSITVKCIAFAKRPLGRRELKGFVDWQDGRAETELNFKLYRQATNKIVGLTPVATQYLEGFF
jgi:hypothetical protein